MCSALRSFKSLNLLPVLFLQQAVWPPGSADMVCLRPPLTMTFLPNLGTLGLSFARPLFAMYATDRRTDKSNAYCPLPFRRGHNNGTHVAEKCSNELMKFIVKSNKKLSYRRDRVLLNSSLIGSRSLETRNGVSPYLVFRCNYGCICEIFSASNLG